MLILRTLTIWHLTVWQHDKQTQTSLVPSFCQNNLTFLSRRWGNTASCLQIPCCILLGTMLYSYTIILQLSHIKEPRQQCPTNKLYRLDLCQYGSQCLVTNVTDRHLGTIILIIFTGPRYLCHEGKWRRSVVQPILVLIKYLLYLKLEF